MIQRIPTGVTQITGTTDALSLVALMNAAAAGKGTDALALNPNYVLLNPEGTIRFTVDGQAPTASTGLEGVDLWFYYVEAPLDKIKIIDAVKVNIAVWRKSQD